MAARRGQSKRLIQKTTILLAVIFGCTTNDIQIAPFSVPPIQASRMLQLFADWNLSLQFDFEQQPQTEGTLLLFSDRETLIFKIVSSTVHNYIKLTFRANSGNLLKIYKINAPLNDGLIHRVIVSLSDNKLRVVDNCRQLFSGVVEDLNHKVPTQDAKVFIANDPNVDGKEVWFRGKVSQFTSDTGDLIPNRCVTNLEVLIDNPVLKETVSKESPKEMISQSSLLINSVIWDRENENDRIDRPLATNSSFSTSGYHSEMALSDRIGYLERKMDHWNTIYNNFNRRIKQVELHLRGCDINGLLLKVGERHRDLTACTECQCSASGNLHCGAIGCPKLECVHPMRVDGQCCPQCGQSCYFNGSYYEHDEKFRPKQCIRCTCNDGSMGCQHVRPPQCPTLNCPNQIIPPNECCPICQHEDYCADHHNPCHADAFCQSGEYAANCTCKPGFFGNGFLCYDVDECLWDKNARQQLGGCLTGAICINLPGSFRCDCMPGFQKLDDRSCLDIIRI